jgi:hypothetical protein
MAINFVLERARRAVILDDLDVGAGEIEPASGEKRFADDAHGFGHSSA